MNFALRDVYKRQLERYEQRFDLYIDLHRDAYIEGVESIQLYDERDQSLAQLMLLIRCV